MESACPISALALLLLIDVAFAEWRRIGLKGSAGGGLVYGDFPHINTKNTKVEMTHVGQLARGTPKQAKRREGAYKMLLPQVNECPSSVVVVVVVRIGKGGRGNRHNDGEFRASLGGWVAGCVTVTITITI